MSSEHDILTIILTHMSSECCTVEEQYS